MEKQAASSTKESSADRQNYKIDDLLKKSSAVEKEKQNSKYISFFRIIFIIILAVFLAGIVFFAFSYYRLNFTPAAILRRSIVNFIDKKNVNYKGNIRLTFLYKDRQEKLSINDIEIYSLLKRSASDNHEVEIAGSHNWENGTPKGSFNLTWSVSDKKIFALEGNYKNSLLSYKVNPYVYSDLVDEDIKKNYSEIDLSEFFSTIATEEDRDLISGTIAKDFIFTVSEVFQDDIIDGSNNFHYKVKLSGENGAERLLKSFKYDDLDVWIDKKSKEIRKIKGSASIENIGVEGNNMDVQFDLKF